MRRAKDRPADRPWSRLSCLKRAFKQAADDIEKEHKSSKAKAEDSLPILIALARLMDKPYLDANGLKTLGEKLDIAKCIGEDWSNGKYSSAKIKLQEAMRQATLDDINKELARLEKATEDALRNNKDPPPRTALETKLKKLLPGCSAGVTLLRVTDANCNQKFLTEREEIDDELSKYWQTVFAKKELKEEEVKAMQEWLDGGVLAEAGQLSVPMLEGMDTTALARKALLRTNNSAAGPDGVPYAAYRRTADISSVVLGDALQDMYYGGGAKTMSGED
jgi:hypothetical protein